MSDIKVSGLRHVYSAGTPFEKVAIDDINIEIPHGQFVGLIGHTGSGKSTFIQHLNALLKPTSGKITVDGEDINADKISAKNVRYKVGLVFQYPEYQLFEETVYADIAFGPKNMGLSATEIDERVREAAHFVGVTDEQFEKSPLELSGGQKRRVAIAGVIAMRPGVLILDEPTAGLDPAGCEQILRNICDYRTQTGSTVIIVSHSMDDVARLADRLVVFNHGGIRFDGTPEEVFSQPEELRSIGLAVPAATELAMELKKLGLKLPNSIYTNEQLEKALVALKRRGE
ncbi:cobalt ABC transporter ATP-binding protein [Firmicutes bacterium CAG:555]|nr:cobalt ABC transporter ATP-binding protein [Firmicutes bacterium CAG:555]